MRIYSFVKSKHAIGHTYVSIRKSWINESYIFIDEIFLYLEPETTHIETSVFFLSIFLIKKQVIDIFCF